jgi:NAD(P)-dependent dehydrogenase (short-subunit alcohol dehydrogenase family)
LHLLPALLGKIYLSSGIGFETAVVFVKEGAEVALADVNAEAGEKALAKLFELVDPSIQAKKRAIFIKVDVSKEEQVKAAIEQTESTFGKLNIVFNNAGIMHPDDDNAITTKESVWDLTMNINVKGVWFGCKHGIAALRRAGGGSIINTASFVGKLGAATPQLAYTASKGAVLAMTRGNFVLNNRIGRCACTRKYSV